MASAPPTSIPANCLSLALGSSLWLGSSLLLGSSLALSLGSSLAAQTHKVAAPERVTRAVGVYEFTGELPKPNAARLVPVTLFINGHLEDAGAYLSRPAPFALQTGDIYSIERAGNSIGTLDLDVARNIVTRRSATDDAPLTAWYGYGRFAGPTPTAPPKLSKAATPGKIVSTSGAEDNEDRPTLLRREDAAPSSTARGKVGTGPAANIPSPYDDPERPTLRHRDPVDPNSAEAKHKREKPGGYVSGPATSLNDDPNRPSLHRGVPAAQVAASQLEGAPPVGALHQLVAVSDPANREPHLFTREWESAAEHTQALADLETVARNRIGKYIAANHFATVTAATRPALHTAPVRTAARKATAMPVALNGENLRAYTLSYGGLPTFVYTAVSPIANDGAVYLTLVAQRLPSGELQVELASVTDAAHLDRVPWMRPIDAVDADGSNRASLLFELRAQSSRQFALYRLVTAQAEQTFLSGILQ